MIKAVIIDDEPYCRSVLNSMLSDFVEGVELLGEAADVTSGIRLIQETQPDLVFLDIEMPGGDGFTVLNAFEQLTFKVIFTTSYNQYALRAIKYAALDYLLKPIGLEELELAINKYYDLATDQKTKPNFLHANYLRQTKTIDEISLPGRTESIVINIQQISHIESGRDHVVFYLEDQVSRISTQPLSLYESILPTDQFFRIHKSCIVNCAKVRNIESGRSGRVIMQNGKVLSVATRRRTAFVAAFNQFHQQS